MPCGVAAFEQLLLDVFSDVPASAGGQASVGCLSLVLFWVCCVVVEPYGATGR